MGAAAPFWHRVSKIEQTRILGSRMRLGTFMRRFRQPRWCRYPEALAAMMGCWSLMIPGKIGSVQDCLNCSMCADARARQRRGG